MFMLPFVLGLIGLFYHFKKKGSDALVNFLLFFLPVLQLSSILINPVISHVNVIMLMQVHSMLLQYGLVLPFFILLSLQLSWNKKLLKDVLTGGGIVALFSCFSLLLQDMGAAAGITVGIGNICIDRTCCRRYSLCFKILENQAMQ